MGKLTELKELIKEGVDLQAYITEQKRINGAYETWVKLKDKTANKIMYEKLKPYIIKLKKETLTLEDFKLLKNILFSSTEVDIGCCSYNFNKNFFKLAKKSRALRKYICEETNATEDEVGFEYIDDTDSKEVVFGNKCSLSYNTKTRIVYGHLDLGCQNSHNDTIEYVGGNIKFYDTPNEITFNNLIAVKGSLISPVNITRLPKLEFVGNEFVIVGTGENDVFNTLKYVGSKKMHVRALDASKETTRKWQKLAEKLNVKLYGYFDTDLSDFGKNFYNDRPEFEDSNNELEF